MLTNFYKQNNVLLITTTLLNESNNSVSFEDILCDAKLFSEDLLQVSQRQ